MNTAKGNRLQPPSGPSPLPAGSGGSYAGDITRAATMDVTGIPGPAPGAITPTRLEHGAKTRTVDGETNKRKMTLLSLLDALTELQKDEEMTLTDARSGAMSPSKMEKAFEEPTEEADERVQTVGAEAFNKFKRRMNNLDRELRNFANASRQLGSSVGLLSSAFHLRERIAQVLYLFHENAADLFPRKVQHHPIEVPEAISRTNSSLSPITPAEKPSAKRTWPGKKQRRKPHRAPPQHVARPVILEHVDPESTPHQLEMLARDVMTFLNSLNEFPEFRDEAVNNSIESFEADLKYWASCLKDYKGQFKYPAVQQYLHDLTSEMGDHLDTITSSLAMFMEVGIPTIRFAQKHAATNLGDLTTVATFFSAVTATTIQFSYQLDHNLLADAVNSFWFISLVFSIASAVNSLLGLTWKQAMYRSPGHRVPWWVLIWMKRSPLVFLVISVGAFSVGLCLFTYASHQARVTSTLTTIFTIFSSFGLTAVSAWFIFERWTFNRHKGKKWLMDVLAEAHAELHRNTIFRWLERTVHVPHAFVTHAASKATEHTGHQLKRMGTGLSVVSSRVTAGVRRLSAVRERTRDSTDRDDRERGIHGMNGGQHGENPEPQSPVCPGISLTGKDGRPMGPLSPMSPSSLTNPLPYSTSAGSLSIATSENSPRSSSDIAGEGSERGTLTGRRRFKNAVQNVMELNALNSGPRSPLSTFTGIAFNISQPQRQRTASSSAFTGVTDGTTRGGAGRSQDGLDPKAAVAVRTAHRVATLMPQLKSMQPTQEIHQHSALVRHLQFSPNGDYLATCSWDRTSMIYKVKDFSNPHRVLAHPQGFVGQVAWSPRGDLLLTKMARGMRIWNAESGVCRKTIDRQRQVQSVAWFPNGEAFLSVEGSDVTKLDIAGKVLATYHFERMNIHDVAISGDQSWMLCVATLTASPQGLKPRMSRDEKRIIVYDLDNSEVENQVPILHDVRDITLAKSGSEALVSYENKAPPQLWKLNVFRDREHKDENMARLSLINTYIPRTSVDFAGPSYFGGKDDQLVLCAGKAGDIHIWDRASGVLLHYFKAQDPDGDLTCIAWNPAASPFMFATGSHDGTVRIWTNPQPQSSAASFVDLRPSGANTPRTMTPPPFIIERTESPTNQDESASLSGTLQRSENRLSVSGRPSSRERASRSLTFSSM